MARNEDYDEESDRSDDAVDAENRVGERTGDDVARRTAAADDETVYAAGREGDDAWLTRGLASVLLVSGVVLLLFPEPATSLLGIGLIAAGLAIWVSTAVR